MKDFKFIFYVKHLRAPFSKWKNCAKFFCYLLTDFLFCFAFGDDYY